MIVREDVHPSQRVTHARADRTGGDRRMSHRETHGRGALALRGIAEGHEPAGDPLRHGDPLEHAGEAAYAGALQEEQQARMSVGIHGHRRSDDPGDRKQRIGVMPLCRDRRAEIRNETHDWERGTRGRIRSAVGARVPDGGRGSNQDDDGAANQRADGRCSHSDSRLNPKGAGRGHQQWRRPTDSASSTRDAQL